ncbi:MAG: VWA domain-containing protein, partial [Deltaproteobacteria bacterium]|nr:VWA domain-containing protein [Deltaproteobacteria bacterium]
MKRIKYRRWEGTPTWHDLDPESLSERFFEELSHYMNWSLSAQEALEWLLRQGLRLPEFELRIMGTDELLQELRRLRQESFQDHNLDGVLDDTKARIEELVRREVATARDQLGSLHPEFQRREAVLRELSPKVSAALEALSAYDAAPGFLDPEAKRIFDELWAQAETLQELEQFILRYGRQFQGPRSLNFEQAQNLMARFKRLSALTEALRSGKLQQISLREFGEELGAEAEQSLRILSQFASRLEEAGFLQQTGHGIRLTPKGFQKIGRNALNEIFQGLRKDHLGLHPREQGGQASALPEASLPYEFGRTFNVHIANTLRNAMRRGVEGGGLRLRPEDFEVHEEQQESRASTVLMLDMSWSMSRDGRFPAAKRVALALDHLIRATYPRDFYHTVGFSTRARELTPEQLTEATWDPSDPFTNIQEGLRLSRSIFQRHRGTNRQVILITDGQPTATHVNGITNAQWPGFMGAIPPDILAETLREVDQCTREKVVINVFMLDD